MKRFFIIIFTAFVSYTASNAQKIWSLQDCIGYAHTNNIQLKQQQLSEQIAKINLLESKTGMLPGINGAASHAYNYGKTIDMYTNQFASNTVQSDNFYISGNVTVFNGFQLLNTVKQNKIDLQTSRFDLDKMKNDISLNIATAYLQILYNIELLDNAQNQANITKQQVERTRKLVDAGASAKGSLLTLEAQEASEELNVVTADNNLDLSYLTLTQMLDLQSSDSFKIAIPLIDIPVESSLLTPPEQIYAFALGVQPEIKSAELKVKSSELGLSIAQGMRSPTLSLRGSYGTGFSGASKRMTDFSYSGYSPTGDITSGGDTVLGPIFTRNYETIPFNDQINDNINKSVSFNLTIPVFNGWHTNAAISRAKIAIQNSEYTLQATRNTLYKSIQQAYTDAVAALNKYKSSQKSVEAMKESFKYAEQKFEVGLVNTTEYNDSKNKLAEAESNLLQAKYEYVFRLKILDFYMGKPIELK